MQKLQKKRSLFCKIGVWIQGEQLELLWFDHAQQAQRLKIPINEIATAQSKITQSISNKLPLKWITGVLPNNLWHKTLLLPSQLSPQECEQRVQYSLQNELPTNLDEIWFDYYAEPLKQGIRLDIFAIMKNVAEGYLAQLSPLKMTVLDNVAHAIVRAFGFLQPNLDLENTLLLYQDAQCSLAILEKAQQSFILQQPNIPIEQLIELFTQRYQPTVQDYMLYCTEKNIDLPVHCQLVETELPFIALGLALWQSPNH